MLNVHCAAVPFLLCCRLLRRQRLLHGPHLLGQDCLVAHKRSRYDAQTTCSARVVTELFMGEYVTWTFSPNNNGMFRTLHTTFGR